MKKTILALVLTLGVPALVAMAQPADEAQPGGVPPQAGVHGNPQPGPDGQVPPPPMGGPGHRGNGPMGPGGGPGHMGMPITIIAALDTNHDGIIDSNEIAHATEALKKLDKNGDGKLTPDEFMGPMHRPGQRADKANGPQRRNGPPHGTNADLVPGNAPRPGTPAEPAQPTPPAEPVQQ